MRVVRLKSPGGLENLIFREEEPSKPRAGEILVKIHASSLNFHDNFVVNGTFPTEDGRIPMNDGAGEVISVGEDVDGFKVGDNVVSTFWPGWWGGEMISALNQKIPGDSIDGYASDYVCMPAYAFTKAPEGYTHVEAATIPTAGVAAWRGLVVCGKIKPGDAVMIQGTGGVSLFALQFAKAAGARVIATSSSEKKLEKLTELGADAVINYKAVPNWGQKAKELTDGRGVDHVVEVGGPDTLMQSITACRTGGHIALIGVLTGFAGEVATGALLSGQTRISAINVGSRADQEDMIRAITTNRLKPIVDRCYPLGEIAAAFKYFETKQHFGKICLEF